MTVVAASKTGVLGAATTGPLMAFVRGQPLPKNKAVRFSEGLATPVLLTKRQRDGWVIAIVVDCVPFEPPPCG